MYLPQQATWEKQLDSMECNHCVHQNGKDNHILFHLIPLREGLIVSREIQCRHEHGIGHGNEKEGEIVAFRWNSDLMMEGFLPKKNFIMGVCT